MMDQIFKKFIISYVAIFFVSFLMVTTLDLIFDRGIFNRWAVNMGMQSIIAVFTSWGLMYWNDPRFVNWKNRVFRKNQPALDVPEPVGVKRKKKPKGEIEKLRNKYGGNG